MKAPRQLIPLLAWLSTVQAAMTTITTAPHSCPTITHVDRCSTCAIPQCALLETITVPCGCPATVASTVISHACGEPSACDGGCALTEYRTVVVPACPTSPPSTSTTTTTVNKSCPTVTTTALPSGCTPSGLNGGPCITPDCAVARSVTVPCSCVPDLPVPTETVTASCTCNTACQTETELLYLPCPYTSIRPVSASPA